MSTCDNENLNLTDLKDKIEDAIEKADTTSQMTIQPQYHRQILQNHIL